MKTYKIIYLKSELKSFSWNDGLFAVIDNKDGVISLCKISPEGIPHINDNGKFSIMCTGSNNKGINPTPLTLKM